MCIIYGYFTQYNNDEPGDTFHEYDEQNHAGIGL